MLKVDLHIHTAEDPYDKHINYSAKQLIDKAVKQNFDVLAITNHNAIYDEKAYARKKGILLIPGIEKSIEGKHVLIYNVSKKEVSRIKKFEDLAKLKRKNSLIVAAHPFFPFVGIGKKLEKYVDLFDGLEISYFFTRAINLNKKAIKFGRNFKKPFIGCSDLHKLKMLGCTYSMVKAEKNINSIIAAIKAGKVKIESKPVSYFHMIGLTLNLFYRMLKRKLYKHFS